jgi:hypothetical protein
MNLPQVTIPHTHVSWFLLSLLLPIMGMGCDEPEVPLVTDVGGPGEVIAFDSGPMGANCIRRTEVCNGIDDDCDGTADETDAVRIQVFSDPDHCGACGNRCVGIHAVFSCRVGQCVISQCEAGYIDYNGDPSDGCEANCAITAGGREVCDETDNDCDGLIDEDFDLQTDPTNCGGCGILCGDISQGAAGCIEGQCTVASCAPDWHDLNDDSRDGCEYPCTVRAVATTQEYCNGLDDDCDGRIDEDDGLARPQIQCGLDGACAFDCVSDRGCDQGEHCGDGRICVPDELPDRACDVDADCHAIHPGLACISRSVRVDSQWITQRRCIERIHSPMCDGEQGYRCAYSPQWQRGDEIGLCDDVDNDCDGRTDEDFVDQLFLADRQTPRPCYVGAGVCRVEGMVECSDTRMSTTCSAIALPPASDVDDTCDAIDQDCDGVFDEDFVDDIIRVGTVDIFAYEASRPGATAERAGLDGNPEDEIESLIEARACSRPGVLPWDDVSWAEAETACTAAGSRLCTAAEFALSCGGPQGEAYPYGISYRSHICNGRSYDADSDEPGIQDGVLTCGAAASCTRNGVFDLSGNLKEWVAERAGNLRAVRGGSYATVLGGGLSCHQEGDWKDRNFRHRSIGFRCCRDIND